MSEGGANLKPLRVLVVEDNDDDAFLLLRELKRSGYATEHRQVCTPEDLNAALAAGPWDVVFSDWNMPRFNGLAAYRMTREKGLDVPFIIVSGTIAEDIAVEALKAGVHDFMTKGKFARLGPALERELREASIRQQRRDADAKLARQQREMEQSARLLRLVIDSVPDAIAVVDRQGHFTTWNAAAADLLDIETWSLAPSEWAKTTGFYHPNRTTQFPADRLPLARALRGESVDSEAIFFRTATHTAGRWLSVNARPLLDDNREVVGAVAAFRDVTNEREQNEKLMISDRMASLGMLAAGVGHEINNPLAAVVANLELAHRATLDAPTEVANAPRDELLEMLSDARAAADQVRQIVRDLRVLARNEESTLSAVNVERVLESSVRLAWNEIRHRARLEKDFKNPAQALASESRLGQVFLNLLVNAAQAIPPGNAENHTIRVATGQDDDGSIVISVSDSGSGMNEETLRTLFTPFFTTKPAGVGTGLGLAICDRIVSDLGGKIRVTSEVGRGTTFVVALRPAATTDAQASSGSASDAAPKANLRARILVVDDEALVVNILRRTFAKSHEVSATTNSSEALEWVRNGQRFDVVFCDLMMPQLPGWELHAEIEKIDAELASRMVFMTGGAFTPAARGFLDRVPNRRIEKPFDTGLLKAIVDERLS